MTRPVAQKRIMASEDTNGDLARRHAPMQTRSRLKVEALLAATERVLVRDGPAPLTTPAIAQEAGVSVGALYHFFPNKEALVLALYEGRLEQVRGIVEEPIDRTGDWRADVARWLRRIKQRETEVGYSLALNTAMDHFPALAAVNRRHAELQTATIARQIRALGSGWPDAALFDLALHAYCLNSAAWRVWAFAGEPLPQAVDRLVLSLVAILEPAFDGEPPAGPLAAPGGQER